MTQSFFTVFIHITFVLQQQCCSLSYWLKQSIVPAYFERAFMYFLLRKYSCLTIIFLLFLSACAATTPPQNALLETNINYKGQKFTRVAQGNIPTLSIQKTDPLYISFEGSPTLTKKLRTLWQERGYTNLLDTVTDQTNYTSLQYTVYLEKPTNDQDTGFPLISYGSLFEQHLKEEPEQNRGAKLNNILSTKSNKKENNWKSIPQSLAAVAGGIVLTGAAITSGSAQGAELGLRLVVEGTTNLLETAVSAARKVLCEANCEASRQYIQETANLRVQHTSVSEQSTTQQSLFSVRLYTFADTEQEQEQWGTLLELINQEIPKAVDFK